MPGGATTISTVRDAIANTLETLSGVKVYDHEPRDLDELPGATIGLPKLERARLGEAENELGRWTWRLIYTLRLYIAADDPEKGQDDAGQLLGRVAGAFDNNETLENSPGVKDTKLETAEPGFTAEDATRQMVIYTCSLAVMVDVS